MAPSSTFWALLKYAWKFVHDQCHTNRVLKVSTEMQHFGKPLEDLGEWEKTIFTSTYTKVRILKRAFLS